MITFSFRNLFDMKNFNIEILVVRVQLPEWWITVLLYVWQYAYVGIDCW